jgi:pimeloyl-ACP methyl ester carboxylesterase
MEIIKFYIPDRLLELIGRIAIFRIAGDVELEKWSVDSNLDSIQVPVLLMHSKSDLIVPFSDSEFIHQNLKNCKFKEFWVVDDVDHSQLFDSLPLEFEKKVLDFINKIYL